MAAGSGYGLGVDVAGGPAAGSDQEGYGWVVFAVLMLTIGGTFVALDGVVALTRSEFFRANSQFVFGDLDRWAWVFIIGGTLSLIAGLTLGLGSRLARWYGIAAASANAFVQLLAMQAYPFWSIAMFAVDVLVVYTLVVRVPAVTRKA